MIDLCQDILPKEFNRFCVDCSNYHKSICDRCLINSRERPFWTLKTETRPRVRIKRATIPTQEIKPKVTRSRLKGFFEI